MIRSPSVLVNVKAIDVRHVSILSVFPAHT